MYTSGRHKYPPDYRFIYFELWPDALTISFVLEYYASDYFERYLNWAVDDIGLWSIQNLKQYKFVTVYITIVELVRI